MKTKLCLLGLLVVGSAVFTTAYGQAKPWPVPDKNAKMANPVKGDGEAVKLGKTVWNKHCSSCHGKAGAGDGTKAAQLETPMEDMSGAVVQGLTDGALFYKISEGRNEMPSFKKKIPDAEELWSVITYIRTLKK